MDHDASPDTHRRPSRVTPAQVIALGLIAASIGWGAWLLRDRPASEEVELLAGTVLPSSELAIVEAAFDRAQLSGHRTEDGRVWVPRPRQSAYMRALVDAEALPREFGSSLRRALERNSPWQSRAAQEELLRVAVQEELSHVICSMPGIERAAVLYDVEDRGSFNGSLAAGPARTASVNVRTQPDIELEPARVQAIRVLVAASIAGLAPDRVAVTDLRSGRVHAGPLEAPESAEPLAEVDPELARRIAHERHLAAKVRQALSFVKGVVVDVSVSFASAAPVPEVLAEPGLPARQQRVADANAPAEVEIADDLAIPAVVASTSSRDLTLDPDTILVTLAVPETWFDAADRAARQRDATAVKATIDRVEEERLREHVLQLLPPGSSSDARRVMITRFPGGSSRAESSTARLAAAAAPVAAAAPSSAGRPLKPQTIGGYVDVTVQAVSTGRFGDVPREVWMIVTAKCSALLAYLMFRSGSGSNKRLPVRQRGDASGPSSRINWASMDESAEPVDRDAPRRRMAA
jgi:type III secretory pathway lipoprotein EscJ